MSFAITEILQVLLLVGVQIVLKHLFDVGILEEQLDALDLSGVGMNALLEFGSLFLQLDNLRGEGCVLDGLLQEVVVGDEDSKLRLFDLSCPLPNLVGVESAVVVVEVFKSESGETNGESFIALSVQLD